LYKCKQAAPVAKTFLKVSILHTPTLQRPVLTTARQQQVVSTSQEADCCAS